jgi:5'(3')-deoxyribonucleotidase
MQAKFIVDLDMVLADFVAGTGIVFNKPVDKVSKWKYYEDWGIDGVRFWQRIHTWGDRFYGELVPRHPWATTLMDAVGDNFIIMSAPGAPSESNPVDWSAKWLWLSKYFPTIPATKLVVGFCKEELAKPHVMLIDDSQDGCEKFAKAGGAVCIFPQLWNSNADKVGQRLQYATDCIAKHKEKFNA